MTISVCAQHDASDALSPRRSDVQSSPWRTLLPLAVDVVVPAGTYYLARYGCQASVVNALITSSVVPVLRSVWSAARERRLNALAALMLAVNVAGIALSFVSGNARVVLAKDSGVSSVIAVGILVSALRGRSVMSAGLEPFVTKGNAARVAAWQRLSVESARFRSLTRRYGLIWGVALLADCVARTVAAFTLPVSMVSGWLSTTILIAAIVAAAIVGGGAAAEPMTALVDRASAQPGQEPAVAIQESAVAEQH